MTGILGRQAVACFTTNIQQLQHQHHQHSTTTTGTKRSTTTATNEAQQQTHAYKSHHGFIISLKALKALHFRGNMIMKCFAKYVFMFLSRTLLFDAYGIGIDISIGIGNGITFPNLTNEWNSKSCEIYCDRRNRIISVSEIEIYGSLPSTARFNHAGRMIIFFFVRLLC